MPTREEFTAAMRAVVEERGRDWRYPVSPADAPEWFTRSGTGGCRYRLDDGSPACIVGAALAKVGLLDQLTPDDEGNAAGVVLARMQFAPEVVYAAEAAQGAQDFGDTWGEALDEYLGTLYGTLEVA